MIRLVQAIPKNTKSSMALAIYSADQVFCRSIKQSASDDSAIAVVGAAEYPSALFRLVDRTRPDVVLIDVPPPELLSDWLARRSQTPCVVLLDDADVERSLDALSAGAQAVLPRSTDGNDIVIAIKAVARGYVVLWPDLVSSLLAASPVSNGSLNRLESAHAPLTPRELEVLAAMANGASNKAIARRLGISLHTVKFHIAAIFEKLVADSRTEAVTKAAQLGLVML